MNEEDIVRAVIDGLCSRNGFEEWWDQVQPSTRDLIIHDLSGVVRRCQDKQPGDSPKPTPPDATRYTYEHTWYDANSKTTLKVCECDTLEEAVSHVMERAILQNLTPPYWWVKP